ncbi:MAG: hypothetical protein JWO36_2226 [Myxococcales bacterium]|nr:hypothetical protein [Myxococcales bacterium]
MGFIRDRIRLLTDVDRRRELAGAASHHYTLGAPLDEAQAQALEARLGVTLPSDYRAFVREIAAHGPGPDHGLVEPSVPEGGAPVRPFVPVFSGPRDGAIVIAEHSLLIITGEHRGEVFTVGDGSIAREAASFGAWYASWADRALIEWLERAAPRLALDGPEDPAELDAIGSGFEAVAAAAKSIPAYRRTLGYLHLRELRYEDAVAAFVAAADGSDNPAPRLHLDRARVHVVKDDPVRAIEEAKAGLHCANVPYETRDELRATLEHALFASNRPDDALAILDQRAAERLYSFDLHHRLARERLARRDLAGAGAALERAAQLRDVMPGSAAREVRVAAAFDPIVSELRAAGRHVDADALEALADRILQAN